jgi:hypothetical protein
VIWPGTFTQPTRIFTGSADAAAANVISPARTAAAARVHIIKRMLGFLEYLEAGREDELALSIQQYFLASHVSKLPANDAR